MKGGWMDTIGALRKGKDTGELLSEYFPDMPKVCISDLNRQMRLIGNFLKYEAGEKNFKASSKAFRDRLEDGEDHIFTMNGYIDFLKNGIEMDIMINYKMYLESEMSIISSKLFEYFHNKMSTKENYPDEAISSICGYIESVEKSISELVRNEMLSTKERLGFKTEETAKSLHKRIKKGVLGFLPA